jgi:5-methylcytosine-specific restriction endonuclease McrA
LVEKDLRKLVFGEERKTRREIPKGVRIDVWNEYIGKDKLEGKCYVCGNIIRITDFEVGHNKAVAKGGSDRKENLRPICRKCNLSMGTKSIEAYKRKYYSKPKKKLTTKKTEKKTSKRRKPKSTLERLSRQVKKDFLSS